MIAFGAVYQRNSRGGRDRLLTGSAVVGLKKEPIEKANAFTLYGVAERPLAAEEAARHGRRPGSPAWFVTRHDETLDAIQRSEFLGPYFSEVEAERAAFDLSYRGDPAEAAAEVVADVAAQVEDAGLDDEEVISDVRKFLAHAV